MYLNCHTYYSLRFGTLSERSLLEMAQELGLKTIALTDINNTSACLNFVRIASEYNIRPILGIDFRKGVQPVFVGLAQNNKGFQELNAYLSEFLHQKNTAYNEEVGFKTTIKGLPQRAPEHISHAFFIYPFQNTLDMDCSLLRENEFIGISLNDLNKLAFSHIKNYKNKLVLLQTVTFKDKRDYNTHRLLRAIDNNTLLSKLPKEEVAQAHAFMYHPKILAHALQAFPDILPNTKKLMERCCINFDFSEQRKPQNLETYTGTAQGDIQLLNKLCADGILYRYGQAPSKQITTRLQKEKELIQKMGFVSYFLINWDIVRYAQSKDYFYIGRGSGANSIIAYLLRITDVDPIDLDLYFERFINLYRKNPPDFDIDFSWRDREDITHYIFSRFPNTALLATYNTFKSRAVIRELGKVFGLPKQEIDQLINTPCQYEHLDDLSKLTLKYGARIKGFPNHLSIHAGGILIAQKPIHYFSATNMPPKGFPTVQFDMHIAEDVGLYKFDILGQRGLAKIKEAIHIVKYNQPEKANFDIHNIQALKTDPNINQIIKQAQCIGCFYVESPAMRMLLKKLEVNDYLGLVAASSIIRPGVAKSGMMREYILRKRFPERTQKKAHPVMLNIMPETYGVMVYQEDVIKVAHYFAGLDLGEADVLRRGMSGKFRSKDEFQQIKMNFINNCRAKGYGDTIILEIWRQVESFAGYAFAKGHSASYAVESYQTLFLKAYFPLEYMVAVLNNGGGFYQPELYIHEARMHGARIHAPCVNNSDFVTCIKGKDVFLGMHYLHELESKVATRIISERLKNGTFISLDDFIDRVPISIDQISILIRINAFRFTNISKRELLWQSHMALSAVSSAIEQMKLFKPEKNHYTLPALHSCTLEDTFDQIELLGFPLENPFTLLKEPNQPSLLNKDLPKYLGKVVPVLGYLIALKNTTTSNGKRMNFGTFLDQDGSFIDTVHFPQAAATFPFRGKGIYCIQGKVVEEFGFYSLEVRKMIKQDYLADPRYS